MSFGLARIWRATLKTILGGAVIGAAALLAPMKAAAEPALWLLQDKDSKVYLFGTIHMLPAGTEWRTPKIDTALQASDELWLEIADLESMFAQLTAGFAVLRDGLSPGTPLSERLTEEQYAELDRVALQHGLSARQLDPMRPWLAGMMLEVSGYTSKDIEPGVDLQLSREFRTRRLPVRGFETIGQQVKVFANMSPEDELDYLLQTVENADAAGDSLGELTELWASGDDRKMAETVVADMKEASPDFYDAILTKRNEGMAAKIARILEGDGVSFVAVGAAHLAGPDSIQAILAKRGIKSTRQ